MVLDRVRDTVGDRVRDIVGDRVRDSCPGFRGSELSSASYPEHQYPLQQVMLFSC